MPELPHTTDSLHPAEDLLHPFAFSLTDRVAFMPGGPSVNRAPAPLVVLRDVRRRVHVPCLLDEFLGVIGFIGTHRYIMIARNVSDHFQSCLFLRRSTGL